MRWIEIKERLDKKKCYFFSVDEFRAIIGGEKLAAKRLLQRYAKRKLVARIKKGRYLVPANKPPDMYIANKLYQPSYISFAYALSYYHLIPETVYTMTSATAKPTREFDAMGRLFTYSKIKTKAYSGYIPKKIDNYTILIATPEKALADYLYFITLKKRKINDRLDIKNIDIKVFMKYISMFNNTKLARTAEALMCSQKKK